MPTIAHKNDVLRNTIIALEKQSKKEKVAIWGAIAEELSAPTRQQRSVNVKKIANLTEKDDAIIVPGKLLGTGVISHSVHVVCHKSSQSAVDKIKAAGGSVVSLLDEMKKNPKGAKLRIIG